ncbi:helix-turn-helix transcriptional regulator [Psychrobacter ciconiae]|uniref:helix-turn-helix transcriptional regulator n=1 Tax=Psychrobacter ciconiae TaxID=1553449 RepID=UPI001919C53B|nr:AlpA family phage regulatory protein [Psychrobacter ciconiae]
MTDKNIDTTYILPPQGLSRAKDILPLLPFGRASLWKFVKTGQFPAPRKITNGITAWRNADVIAWLEAQSAANDDKV